MKRRKLLYDMRRYGKVHPKAEAGCECCRGRGYAVFTRLNDSDGDDSAGKLAVQKCDECDAYKWDETAAVRARKDGIKCRTEYPCLLEKNSHGSEDHRPEDRPARHGRP